MFGSFGPYIIDPLGSRWELDFASQKFLLFFLDHGIIGANKAFLRDAGDRIHLDTCDRER